MLSQRLWGQCLGMMHFRRIAKAMSVSWRMSDLLIPDALASGTSEQTPHTVVPFLPQRLFCAEVEVAPVASCSVERKVSLTLLLPSPLQGLRVRGLSECNRS
mmetsp:Transcript_77959/g.252087  ORF Transcript_77959/g.252087 Transcript_77959/m.252087 type:complete len:102 (-) Transcript_77959:230-535(-)